jgi:hypothetical protein
VKETGKITRINIVNDPEGNFYFLGIVTSEPDYRLSLLINKKLGISLKHSDNEIRIENKNGSLSFSKFETSDREFILVSNKTDTGILIRKLNKVDFLFFSGRKNKVALDSIAASAREISGVTAVFFLNSEEITDRNIEILRHIAG